MTVLAREWLAAFASPWEPVALVKGRRVRLGPPPERNRRDHPYQGTVEIPGLPTILVENARGSTRSGVGLDGKPWSTTMEDHYGEFEGTRGMDGDPVDVFVVHDGDVEATTAYVVHQKVPGTQRPDEDKVVVGASSAEEAERVFRRNYDKGGFFHGITPWPVEELAAYLKTRGHRGKRLDSPERVRAMLKGGRLLLVPVFRRRNDDGDLVDLLKAVIRTPTGADGKVDYDAVPVGASIWVRITAEDSPLHGRPILITKRPDHTFALTGGAAAKYIEARRHLVMQGGQPRTSKADEEAVRRRQEAIERNAPKRAKIRELQKQARDAQRVAESAFMEALGIERRGLTGDEREKVHGTAQEFAKGLGLSDRDATSFATHLANGIARKDRERRVKQAAQRLEAARWMDRGLPEEEALELAGGDIGAAMHTAPRIDPQQWSGMTEPEREALVNAHLDDEERRQELERIEASRFESQDGGEPSPEPAPAATPATETPRPAAGVEAPELAGVVPTPTAAAGPPVQGGNEAPHEQAATPMDGEATPHPLVPAPPAPSPDGPAAPTFTAGHVEEPRPTRPILSSDRARTALDRFREFATAKQAEREIRSTLEEEPAVELAAPASVEELRLRTRALSDQELEDWLEEYGRTIREPPDTAFYDAIQPHWNDATGNTLNGVESQGATNRGAATAITALLGEETGDRYDVQRLVDALGPEAATVAVVTRMREELGERFRAWVAKVRDHNATNQRATERRALARHHQLQKQAEDLEKQVQSGDLRSEATVAELRSRNLLEQRENLGTALGSLQASAALYHFGELAITDTDAARPVVINVGTRLALDDKMKRLGNLGARSVYHPTLGWQIHTDTRALRKFIGRTEQDRAEAEKWRRVKYDTSGIERDDEGREWVPGYKVPGFRSHFPEAEALPPDQQHLAGQPIKLMADQRNNIEWLHGAGGGLVTTRTGGGKTLVSVGVASKMLADNPQGRHLRIVPDGREEQWAAEIRNFTGHRPVVLPARSTKEERRRILASAPPGSIVIVGHTNAGRYDHDALAETHSWDSIGIDEPQELRSKSGSGKLSAGARRIFKISAPHRHALTATPATDHPVEAYDVVNWSRPGALGYRTRFERSFSGFGGGTNAQDAALERMIFRELEPHVSGERLVQPHYGIDHRDNRIRMSSAQRLRQREIEGRTDETVRAAVAEALEKRRQGVRGYAEKTPRQVQEEARRKALDRLEAEHRANLGAGGSEDNPKLQALRETIAQADPSHRHVVFVDSPEQRQAVAAMLEGMGHRGKVRNITASARGATVKRDGQDVAAIEERKRAWKGQEGGFLLIDRTSASGHNLAEGDHLHVLGNPDDAAQLLQVHGRLGRANRVGDFSIHTYRYDDSPFEHARWNRLERQLKVLRATAPGLFVEGKKREPGKMAKGRVLLRAGDLARAWRAGSGRCAS